MKKPRNSAIDTLFSSTQAEVLGLLYGQPERQFMGNELIRQIGRGTGAVHRQLQQLASSGLATVTRRANQTFYQADARHPLFPELRSIFLKTTGLADPLREALEPFKERIFAAFVFGSIAAGRERSTSDVDLMILVHSTDALSYTDLYEALAAAERLLARPVNPVIMTAQEYARKRVVEETFVERVDAGAKIMILGKESDVGGA